MAKAVVTVTQLTISGDEFYSDTAGYVDATAVDGFEFLNDGKTVLHIRNDGTSGSVTLTIDCPNPCDYGDTTLHDKTVAIPQGDDFIIGPFPTHIWNEPQTGKVNIAASHFDNVSAKAFKI